MDRDTSGVRRSWSRREVEDAGEQAQVEMGSHRGRRDTGRAEDEAGESCARERAQERRTHNTVFLNQERCR